MTVRPECKFFNEDLSLVKRNLRKLERQKNHSSLTVHSQIFDATTNSYHLSHTAAKSAYYNSLILEVTSQGAAFKIADKLLHATSDPILPKHDSALDLAHDFAQFFSDKVSKIQMSLATTTDLPFPHDPITAEPPAISTFTKFKILTESEVLKLIKNSPIKSLPLDPIPADLPTLLPVLTSIVNLSLQQGIVPSLLKSAQLSPILKKASLDPETLNNYRPISNLTYLSKLVERAVTAQLTDYLSLNNLLEPYQSAY